MFFQAVLLIIYNTYSIIYRFRYNATGGYSNMPNPCKFEKRRHPILNIIKKFGRLVFPTHTVISAENIDINSPAVYICNHSGAYGPVVMELFFPSNFRPWVIYNVTEKSLCKGHIANEFLKKEVKIKEPFNKWIASIIAPLCIRIMKSVEAIPVYKGKTKIFKTFSMSLESLMQGYDIVIFPENENIKFSKYISSFHNGFVHLARQYYREIGEKLNFYPVYANMKTKTITIGKPVTYSAKADFNSEKEYIANYLRNSIHEIASSQEEV